MIDQLLQERLEAYALAVNNQQFYKDLISYAEIVKRDDFERILNWVINAPPQKQMPCAISSRRLNPLTE